MSQQGAVKEYVVRTPKCTKKKFNMMRFHSALGVDFKSWGPTKMERENNLKEYKHQQDEQPKFGAGSEYGREEREEARRKRYGIHVKKYKEDDQPWLLNVDGKHGKKFKGIREGGVSDNVSYYVFMQAKDGAFEAYPVEEWYNFQPINRYKSLSAEEAELEFERRDKIMNYFSVMYQKKYNKKEDEVEEENANKKKVAKGLLLSEMDDWMSDADSNEDKEDESDNETSKKSKKKGKGKKGRKKQGGKRRKLEDGASEDDVDEESDDYNEGQEHDYISADSSDSEQENDEVARKQLGGVDEEESLKKLLDSEEEESDEEKKKEGEENKEKDGEDKEKKKKKKKKKDKKEKANLDSDGNSSDSSSDDGKNDDKNNVNALKRKIKESPHEMNPSKKARTGQLGASSSATPVVSDNGVSEDLIRRYLMRKPMTTKELLQKCRNKKTGLTSEELVTAIAQTLKRINLNKKMIKGKMYLSVK